ncbi:hypothetical protein GCM10010106_04350 [Thermopolyspora flexuosa]|uniref:Uncharacterized protein n=1 Tax=Thermopolyspora flexuosa TaxID=103836 RepID=A0A543IYS0_9ACTN|nr:hypothetical protein [Thermopolyspora flexuosa]TQM75718.1 hypothetical protein FHX40_2436 [Thermopolyspora flexuosa]GGM61532.1 hypothetical protein GCM10010106_04350 [Thermopolyspora flexuosa]
MRHVFGLLGGVLLTAALLVGTGWAGHAIAQRAPEDPTLLNQQQVLIGLGVLAVVGLILGVVIATRVSPLAVFVPSIVLLAWTVVYVLDVDRAMSLAPVAGNLPQDLILAGRGMQALLTSGVYLMLGIALFIPVLMPSRWARPDEDEDYDETESYF